jgi:hypothetical protein
MTYKELKNKVKEEQKLLAQKIRNGKSGRKPKNRQDSNYDDWYNLPYNQHTYRHRHIMYCHMFNRTPYDAIEQPRDENRPSSYTLERIEKEWVEQLDEALRYR